MIIDLTPGTWMIFPFLLFIAAVAIANMCIIDWLFRKLDKGK
jgi:hypothetical protein